MASALPGPQLVRGWQPGLIGWIVAEHSTFYSRHWNLGMRFEAMVARDLGALVLGLDPSRDLLLSARDNDGPLGAVAVQGETGDCARIRFFIVAERARGRGLGRRLLREAMAFVSDTGRTQAWLSTFAGLDAARALYEAEGFRLVHESADETWGEKLLEQRFAWSAHPGPAPVRPVP
jgi:GNAT superfamily N-acetyltransferase